MSISAIPTTYAGVNFRSRLIHLTHYKSANDNSTDSYADLTWDQLIDAFSEHDVRPTKDGECYSPVTFKPNSIRNDDNVELLHGLVLDIDKNADGTPLTTDDAAAALTRLVSHGLRMIVHTSYSHTEEKPSLRAFIQLSKDVPGVQARQFYQKAAQSLGIPFEPKCANPSRVWYAPACPPNTTPEVCAYDGVPFDVDSIELTPEETKLSISAPIQNAIGEGGRNSALVALAGSMRHMGVSKEAIEAVLKITNQERCNPPLSDAEVSQIATKIARYQPELDRAGDAAVIAAVVKGTNIRQTSGFSPSLQLDEVAALPIQNQRIIPTGMPDLDRRLGGGLWARRMTAVVAGPGAGKTALCIDRAITIESRLEDSAPILDLSTELEADELLARFASPLIGVPWRDILSKPHIYRERALAAVAKRRIRVVGCDQLPRTTNEVLDAIRYHIDATTELYSVPPLVICDYMQQFVRGEDPKLLRSKITDVSKSLREISQSRDCALMAVLSCSRSYYGGDKAKKLRELDDPEAYMAAAKESGDVEYDCRGILFLDVLKKSDAPTKPARIVVAKCNMGETGFVGARFDGAYGRWTSDAGAVEEVLKSDGQDAKTCVFALVTKVKADIECGKFHTVRQVINNLGLKGAKAALDDALESGTLEVQQILRQEGLHMKPREVVVPRGYKSPLVNKTSGVPRAHYADPSLSGVTKLID